MDQIFEGADKFHLQTLGFNAGGYLEMGTQGIIASGNCNDHAVRHAWLPDDPNTWHSNQHYSRSGLHNIAQPLDYRGKQCVFKILDTDPLYIKEARIMSRLRHRSIVLFYDAVIIDNSRLYIIMERSSGGTLEQFVGKCFNDGAMSPEVESINVVKDLLAGLRYLHQYSQCCHCDIHVGNVMIFTDANFNTVYKYIDFGSAALAADTPPQRFQQCVARDIQRLAGVMNNIYRVTHFQNQQFQEYMNNFSYIINREDTTLQQLIDAFPFGSDAERQMFRFR